MGMAPVTVADVLQLHLFADFDEGILDLSALMQASRTRRRRSYTEQALTLSFATGRLPLLARDTHCKPLVRAACHVDHINLSILECSDI